MKHTPVLPQITNHDIVNCSTCSLSHLASFLLESGLTALKHVSVTLSRTTLTDTRRSVFARHMQACKIRSRKSSVHSQTRSATCLTHRRPCEIQIPSLVFSCETEIGIAAYIIYACATCSAACMKTLAYVMETAQSIVYSTCQESAHNSDVCVMQVSANIDTGLELHVIDDKR